MIMHFYRLKHGSFIIIIIVEIRVTFEKKKDNLMKKPQTIHTALNRTMAFVLAGGRGSRLKDLTNNRAKPAIPFGGKYRIIDFPLSNCINSSIRRVVVPTQYKSHILLQHVNRAWSFLHSELGEFVWGMPAQQQIDEQTWYRGTADAIFQNLPVFDKKDVDYVLILAGDHVYKQDYSKMLYEHIERGADVSISCVEVSMEEAKRFGIIETNKEGAVLSFQEKPENPICVPGEPDKALASMGIYIFNKDFLIKQLNIEAEKVDTKHDFGGDILPRVLGSCNMYAHRFSSSAIMNEGSTTPYWRDVGTLDSYWEASMDLNHVTPELNLYDEQWPIGTHQVHRPAAKFVFNDDDRRGYAVDSIVSAGCIISGSVIDSSLLSTNCRVHSYCKIHESVLLPNVEVKRHCQLSKVIVDSHVTIPEGAIIGGNPERDKQFFHVTEGGVTLVTKEMIEKYQA